MTGPMDDRFEGMAADVAAQIRRAMKKVRFQELAVIQLLDHYRLRNEEAALRQLCYDQTGERHLLFSWFLNIHPDFPVWLGAQNLLVEVPRQFVARYRLSPNKKTGRRPVLYTRLFRALDDLRAHTPVGWESPVALVFRWWHSLSCHPWKVLHTADTPLTDWREQVRIETTDGSETVTLEDLNPFLSGLRWSP